MGSLTQIANHMNKLAKVRRCVMKSKKAEMDTATTYLFNFSAKLTCWGKFRFRFYLDSDSI